MSWPKVTVLADQATFGAGERKAETVFDGLGREIESRLYEPSSTFSKTLTEYDNMGRVRRTSNPFRTGSPDWTTNTYDALSRVTLVAHPDGSQAATFYNGSKAVVRDPAGKRLLSESDALGRLISVTEDPPCQTWESNCPSGSHLDYTTTYVYDILDNLTQVTQGALPNAQTRTFAYDSLSRLICASNPETRAGSASCAGTPATSGLDRFTYDANGNLLTKLDSRGVTTTFAYENLNRVTSKTFSGTPTAPNVTYTYDNTSVNFSKGRLTSVSSSASTTNVVHYDARGRVVQGNQQTEGQTYGFSYAYLKDNSLASITYPSGLVVSYAYDNAGRPTSLAGQPAGGSATNYASSMTYAAHGAMGQLQLGNNVWETSAYNSRLQPSSMVTGTTQGGSNLLSLAFGYGTSNNNGNVLSQTITMPKQTSGTLTLTQAYGYDGVNRLGSVGETVTAGGSGGGAWNQGYEYDRFGNRAATGSFLGPETPPTLSAFDSATNRLDNEAPNDWADYDNAGNLAHFKFPGNSAWDWTASYDAENRQRYFCANKSVACGSGNFTAEYHYDGDGRRVKRVLDGQTTVFVYDAFGMLAAEYSTATPTETGGRRYRTTDHLGSTRLVTNSAGAVVSRHDYVPFGEELQASSSAGNRNLVFGFGVSPSERHKFTGKERDVESGLDYFGARYFGSGLGRFTSPDAPFMDQHVENPQSWNLYTYVRNRPLTYIDPTGQAIQLLGETDEERRAELEAIKASLVNSRVADQLSIKQNDQGRFLVGIEGDIIEFQKAGDLEADLGALIASATTVEFGLNDVTYTRPKGVLDSIFSRHSFDVGAQFGGATTHRADGSRSGNIQVVVDPNDIRNRLTEAPTPTLGEAVAHELLGHAIGFVISPTAVGATTNRRAVDAENRARRRGGLARGTRTTHYGGFPR